jgi:hypothetical protein
MGPSGMAYIDGTFFIAGLTSQRFAILNHYVDRARPLKNKNTSLASISTCIFDNRLQTPTGPSAGSQVVVRI